MLDQSFEIDIHCETHYHWDRAGGKASKKTNNHPAGPPKKL